MPRKPVATIEVFDRGYESEHPRFRGNRIIKKWKKVIKVPSSKKGQGLNRYKRRDIRHVLKKKGEDARDIDAAQVIIEWLEALKRDFEAIDGQEAEINSRCPWTW
jgi:hypothetical protein